jgi:hypothetical protein
MGGRVQLFKNESEKTIEPERPPISFEAFCHCGFSTSLEMTLLDPQSQDVR